MHSRNEYPKELQGRYFMATSRKTNLLSWMNTARILIKTENMPLGEYAPSLQLPKKGEKENRPTMAT